MVITKPHASGNSSPGASDLFLRVDDFDTTYERMRGLGVEFTTTPRHEAYGTFAVFTDVAGNLWDLLGPAPIDSAAPAG